MCRVSPYVTLNSAWNRPPVRWFRSPHHFRSSEISRKEQRAVVAAQGMRATEAEAFLSEAEERGRGRSANRGKIERIGATSRDYVVFIVCTLILAEGNLSPIWSTTSDMQMRIPKWRKR
jgi:hypothetical protein